MTGATRMPPRTVRPLAATAAAALAFGGLALAGAPSAFAAPGDNGDIKIHKVGTPNDDQRSDPRVCNFYLAAFNFDTLQEVDWEISPQPPRAVDPVLDGIITLGGTGRGHTAPLTLPNGRYKLVWTYTGQSGAAKSKVFQVRCPGDVITNPSQPPNGGVENGGAANGGRENGGTGNGADGTTANGTGGNGTTANGTGANGTGGNGTTANGTTADGTTADGTTANGTTANGTGANGTGGNGNGWNGSGGNGNGGNGGGGNGSGGNGSDWNGSGGNGSGGNGNAWNGSGGNGPDKSPNGPVGAGGGGSAEIAADDSSAFGIGAAVAAGVAGTAGLVLIRRSRRRGNGAA